MVSQEKSILQFLEEIEFFKVFTREEIADLLWAGEWIRVTPNRYIIREGEIDLYLYVLVQGTAEVVLADRILAVLKAGETFGEFGLMGARRTAHVLARTECLLLGFNADHLNTLNSEIQIKLLKQLLFTLLARLNRIDRKNWHHHTTRWS